MTFDMLAGQVSDRTSSSDKLNPQYLAPVSNVMELKFTPGCFMSNIPMLDTIKFSTNAPLDNVK